MGCATKDCGDPNCPVCRWSRTPPTPRCSKGVDGRQCRLVAMHQGPCKPPYSARKKQTDEKHYDPLLF